MSTNIKVVAAHGYFSDDDPMRLMMREGLQLLGSGRSLLMQVAHPSIADGVENHSAFYSEPWARLKRTLQVMQGFIFGDVASADKMAAALKHIHKKVSGENSRGERYSAFDEHLTLWVYACFIDTMIATHEAFRPALSQSQRKRYYQEALVIGELFGIERAALPQGELET